jgi:hypothetical protein
MVDSTVCRSFTTPMRHACSAAPLPPPSGLPPEQPGCPRRPMTCPCFVKWVTPIITKKVATQSHYRVWHGGTAETQPPFDTRVALTWSASIPAGQWAHPPVLDKSKKLRPTLKHSTTPPTCPYINMGHLSCMKSSGITATPYLGQPHTLTKCRRHTHHHRA